MADKRIDQLPDAPEIGGDTLIAGFVGGVTSKIYLALISAFVRGEITIADITQDGQDALATFLTGATEEQLRDAIGAEQAGTASTLIGGLAAIASSGDASDLNGPPHVEALLTSANQAAALSAIGAQPSDADLSIIAGLTATTDNFMQAKSGAWASRTVVQVKTDLGLSNGFISFTGPASTGKTFTLPNANATILTDSALITGAQGGTGVNNSGKTFAIGGNFTTSGAFACTLTVTAATNVTLPTTGTLPAIATSGTPADLASTAGLGSSGLAARADHVHKAPGATKAISSLGGNYTLTGAASVYTATGLSIVLPVAGTYDLSAFLDIASAAGYGAFYIRFINTTTASVIGDIRLRNDSLASDQSWFPSIECVTTGTNQTIALHAAESTVPGTRGYIRAGSYLRGRLASAT